LEKDRTVEGLGGKRCVVRITITSSQEKINYLCAVYDRISCSTTQLYSSIFPDRMEDVGCNFQRKIDAKLQTNP
jgi:hypothetical protein